MKCEFERQNADWKRKSEFFCSMDGRVKLCNFYGFSASFEVFFVV